MNHKQLFGSRGLLQHILAMEGRFIPGRPPIDRPIRDRDRSLSGKARRRARKAGD